jgi:hypothetical protein
MGSLLLRRRAVITAGSAAALLLASVLTAMAAGASPQEDDASSMVAPLAAHGFRFEPADPADAHALSQSAPGSFVSLAVALFGAAPEANAYAGRLTVAGYRQAGADSPLVIADREVVAVRLRGIVQFPMGAREVTNSDRHTELVVFFDAVTGEFLVATTSR